MTFWQRLKNVVSAIWCVFDPKAQERYVSRCAENRVKAQSLKLGEHSHRESVSMGLQILSEDLRDHGGPLISALVEEGARLLREGEA